MNRKQKRSLGIKTREVMDTGLKARLNQITEHQNTMYYMIATMLKQQGLTDEQVNELTKTCKEQSIKDLESKLEENGVEE